MKFSLKKKITALIIIHAVVLTACMLLISNSIMQSSNDRQYRERTDNLAATVAETIDVDRFIRLKEQVLQIYDSADKVGSWDWGSDAFNAYSALYDDIKQEPDYTYLCDHMRMFAEINGVDCIYLSFVDPVNEYLVYVVDSDEEDPCPPGCVDILYDVNKQVLKDPATGFPAYITNTEEYGWLVTAGAPVYGPDEEVAGYLFVDVSMNEIRSSNSTDIIQLILVSVSVTALLCVLSLIIFDIGLISPLKKLSDAAKGYNIDTVTEHHDRFARLDIRSGDEIGMLADSMKKMERDLNEQISNLLKSDSELRKSKIEVNEMTELATKDSLTGVRNKNAYDRDAAVLDREISEGTAKFGIAIVDLNFLKHTNDCFGHEEGNASIITLCRIICSVFVHSPVFRIGGDEFAVILKNNDYDKIDELIYDFKSKVKAVYADESLRPWERVTAAIGYALYDSSADNDVIDVFRRADSEMYHDKYTMKANGVKPLS